MIDAELKQMLEESPAKFSPFDAIPGVNRAERFDLECKLVGSILAGRSRANALLQMLTPIAADDFKTECLRSIVAGMFLLAFDGADVSDPGAVVSIVRDCRDAGSKVAATLAEAMNSTISPANFEYYRSCLINVVVAEKESTEKSRATKAINEAGIDPEIVARELNVALSEIRDHYLPDAARNTVSMIAAAELEVQLAEVNAPEGAIKTGIPSIDRLAFRLLPGEVIVLGARPSTGKTALALQIALNQVYVGGRVCMFSLEMSAKQLAARLLCNIARADTRKLTRCPEDLTSDERAHLFKFMPALRETMASIDVCEDIRVNTSSMRRFAAESVSRGAKLIIIDYLQLFGADKQRGNAGTREREVAEISREVKALARELRVPAILLSQLSRAGVKGDSGDGRPPILSDLRDSGCIEQDADIVWLLHDPEANKQHGMSHGDRDIVFNQAKGRDVGIGRTKLRFWAKWQMFGDCYEERGDQQNEPQHEPLQEREPTQERWYEDR